MNFSKKIFTLFLIFFSPPLSLSPTLSLSSFSQNELSSLSEKLAECSTESLDVKTESPVSCSSSSDSGWNSGETTTHVESASSSASSAAAEEKKDSRMLCLFQNVDAESLRSNFANAPFCFSVFQNRLSSRRKARKLLQKSIFPIRI